MHLTRSARFTSPLPALLVAVLMVSLVSGAAGRDAEDAGAAAHADAPETEAPGLRAGAAVVDVTPGYPVRLSGFGFRRQESEGVTQRIHARALAIDDGGGEGPAVLVAVDNLGVPDAMVRDLAARLESGAAVRPHRVTVAATHTHTAPMLTGVCPTLFGEPIPEAHRRRIDRYTRELAEKLEEAALTALERLEPASLAWAVGSVDFAVNRRTEGGPVDHDLPVLVVRDAAGAVRAVHLSYACHCVTLSDNRVSGDWAGFASAAIEERHRGALAVVTIGCGADANPSSGVTGGRADIARGQGERIAAEVDRLLAGTLRPLGGPLAVRHERFDLPLDELPDRAEWEARAGRTDAIGHHARVQLARLDRGEALATRIGYSVQTWAFGDRLAMVFLPGEVVVDYALRLERELDRVWVVAYANDAPCYIPSERVLREGGYEGGGAMIYYDVPARLRPGLEERIVGAVKAQLGARFAAGPARE